MDYIKKITIVPIAFYLISCHLCFIMETPTSPPGTIFCLFCKGVVNVKDEKLEKFKKHMEDIHEIYFEHEFILAGSFLMKTEKENINSCSK